MAELTHEEQHIRTILKKHAARYGDSRYEPAHWVVDAMRDAIQLEQQRIIPIVSQLYVHGHWSGHSVLAALEKITGQKVNVVESGRISSHLVWEDDLANTPKG